MYKNYEDILKVRLVSYTKPTDEFKDLIDDENKKSLINLIAFCARVSNPSNQSNIETSDKLLKYLIKNRHWSPFEMVNICLEITTTRDIARQILRHQAKFQEFSQRYSNPLEELEFCIKECRLQDDKNRQNSNEVFDNEELKTWWRESQIEHLENVTSIYKKAINRGVAKEVARVILPEGNTVSRMYMNNTLRNWIHFLEVRESNGTQKEHRLVALEVMKAINEVFPQMYSILEGKKV